MNTSDSRTASRSQACVASSRRPRATTSRRATFQRRPSTPVLGQARAAACVARASFSWASSARARKTSSMPLPRPRTSRSGRRRGSYLVVRRLQQDVPAFYSFVARGATRVGIAQDKFAAMLVGRWPSGAPILRVPGGDNPALGDDDFANNHFIFDDDTRPSSLRSDSRLSRRRVPAGGRRFPGAGLSRTSRTSARFTLGTRRRRWANRPTVSRG